MHQKIYSLMIIAIAMVVMYLYTIIFNSSLRFEKNKVLFYSNNFGKESISSLSLKQPISGKSYFSHVFVRSPLEVELYLRSRLFNSVYDDVSQSELKSLYQSLLIYRPTWPYYHTGLSQVEQLSNGGYGVSLKNAVNFGPHEKKVAKSVSEILFYNWNTMENKTKLMILDYLMRQEDSFIGSIVKISAKFAKVYEYCDYIYERKRVEYAACKHEYWQPLSNP